MPASALDVTAVRRNPGGQLQGLVAVAHPYLHRRGQPGKQRRLAVLDGDIGVAVLAPRRRTHLAAQMMHDEVQSVADAQDRHAQIEHFGIGGRRIGVIHRRRPARENHADGLVIADFSERDRARQDDGKYVQLANAPRDQLRILRAKIEDDDCLGVHSLVWQGPRGAVKE